MRATSLFFGFVLLVALIPAARAEFSAEEWEVLKTGEAVASETFAAKPDGAPTTDVLVKIWIKAPREKVWATIRDYDRFGEFMPRVQRCRVVKSDGETFWICYETEVLGIKVIYYMKAVGVDKFRRIEFNLAEDMTNDIKGARGYWALDDAPDRKGTVLSYSAFIDTGIPMPESLARRISKPNMIQAVKNVKQRVESGNSWKKGEEAPIAP